MMFLSDDKQADVIDAFNTTSRYLDDILKAVAIDSRLSQGIQWLLTAGCHQRICYCQPAVTSEFAADSQ